MGCFVVLFGFVRMADASTNSGEYWYSRSSELVSPRRE